MTKKISVIIPIYNGEKYLQRCVNSIIKQTYKNIEVILVNDGSTDNTDKLCKELQKKDKRIIYIKQENSGVSTARNNGIENASGEYICFVDCDDWVDEKYCEMMLKGMKKDVQLSVVGIKPLKEEIIENLEIDEKINIIEPETAYKFIFTDNNFFGYPVNKLYKKSIIKKIGNMPFDTNIHACEDTLFNAKYLTYCKKIAYNKLQLYFYFQHEGSATKNPIFNIKRTTVFNSLNKIEEIYLKKTPNNLIYLYIFYMYNYYIIYLLINRSKSNYILNKKKATAIYKYILKSKQISFIKKIKIAIKFRLPKLNNYIFQIRKHLKEMR